MDNKIDFVITWVDDSDINWISERNKYCKRKIDESRYRDWGFLKYWFRSIEENTPWVNKIFFITFGHVPDWLNINHPKLVIVNHEDYIPKKYLPTFNSCVLEMNLMNIKKLSEKFVYFNDDVFINDSTNESDFFVEGKPLDNKNLEKIYFYGKNSTKINYNCAKIINKYFKVEKVNTRIKIKDIVKFILSFPNKPINGLASSHMPTSFLKQTFEDVWTKENNELLKICNNKFRTSSDVSQWIFQYWQIASNNYIERSRNLSKYYDIDNKNINAICDNIKNKTNKFICLNDGETAENFNEYKTKILKAFEERYKIKSSFEK